jgi:hypothetical protein
VSIENREIWPVRVIPGHITRADNPFTRTVVFGSEKWAHRGEEI